ncbi:MAG: BspA family leucine-rich repeat surface protein, partial [Christensenellales bacterium]
NLDTSSVTTMEGMFALCPSLTSLNLSKFKTSSVTDMNVMFYNCSSLTSLDLSSFDTSSVANMTMMFAGCSNLKTLNLSSFSFDALSDATACIGMTGINPQYLAIVFSAFGDGEQISQSIYQSDDINVRISTLSNYILAGGFVDNEDVATIYATQLFNTKIDKIIAPTNAIKTGIVVGLPGEDVYYNTNNAESEGQYLLTSGSNVVLAKQKSVPSTGVAINFAIFGVISLASLFAIALSFAFNKKSKRYVQKL